LISIGRGKRKHQLRSGAKERESARQCDKKKKKNPKKTKTKKKKKTANTQNGSNQLCRKRI